MYYFLIIVAVLLLLFLLFNREIIAHFKDIKNNKSRKRRSFLFAMNPEDLKTFNLQSCLVMFGSSNGYLLIESETATLYDDIFVFKHNPKQSIADEAQGTLSLNFGDHPLPRFLKFYVKNKTLVLMDNTNAKPKLMARANLVV